MYFYSETAPREAGFAVPYHRQNATAAYLRHYGNLMFLKFMANNSQDRAERQQAELEIPICERKLKHWENHGNFERDVAMRGVQKIKSE